MAGHISRRRFLQTSTAAGTAVIACGVWSELPAAESTSPNEKPNIGIIGVNHRGRSNTNGVSSENIAALCDVDANYLDASKKDFPQAQTFRDWRKLCEQKNIDAVVVSTTDHTHALASVMAMKTGKHVYCEKPLAHSVHEAHVVRQTYKESKVATQMGTQIHAGNTFRRVVELIRSGAIGPVREAHVWCDRVGRGGDRPQGKIPVPSHLDWDLWLGPAPQRAYHSSYLPGCMTWEQWWDWGSGTIGDMGSHLIDLPYWALDLKHPISAEAEGPPVHEDTYPKWLIVRWEHPAAGDRPAVKLTWYDGGHQPEAPEGVNLKRWGNGILFVGDNGKLLADYERIVLLPKDKFADFEPPQQTIPPSLGHYKEWIHACKTGAPTLCNFEYSGRLIQHNLLGTVAYRTGKKLQWDAENLKATNCPDAERYIRREYRKGWTL